MTGTERGFHNFHLGDNPYELGNQAVRRLAALTDIELGAEPNADEIQEKLFANWGREKEYRANAETFEQRLDDGQTMRGQIADIVEESGVTNSVEPRRIDGERAEKGTRRKLVIPAGVFNWMLRRTDLAEDIMQMGYLQEGDEAIVLGSGRVMASPTEVGTEFVQRWEAQHNGQSPRELDYQHAVTAPRLGALGLRVRELYFDEPKPVGFKDQISHASGLLDDGDVLVAQNAPAGSTWADMRHVVEDDRLYFATDSINVARTDRQEADALHYQKYSSALSVIPRWVKAIHEINTHYAN